MFMNPYISAELGRQRHQEMLARAERQRLARRQHATPGTAPSRQRLRGVLRAAARLRPAPGT
jgi:hypothetical protein